MAIKALGEVCTIFLVFSSQKWGVDAEETKDHSYQKGGERDVPGDEEERFQWWKGQPHQSNAEQPWTRRFNLLIDLENKQAEIRKGQTLPKAIRSDAENYRYRHSHSFAPEFIPCILVDSTALAPAQTTLIHLIHTHFEATCDSFQRHEMLIRP